MRKKTLESGRCPATLWGMPERVREPGDFASLRARGAQGCALFETNVLSAQTSTSTSSFHLTRDFLCHGDKGFVNPYKEGLHRRFERAQISLERKHIKEIHKGEHDAVATVVVVYVFKDNIWKSKKKNVKKRLGY